MSYNIGSIEIVNNHGFRIIRNRLELLQKALHRDDIPEGSVFDFLDAETYLKPTLFTEVDGVLKLHAFWWYGEAAEAATTR